MLSKNIVVHIKNINVSYGDKKVLDDFSVNFFKGKRIGVIGANGSGKSTLLKAMIGFLKLENGEILFWGNSLKKERNKIAYLPQRESVDWDFPASVLDVVVMGLYKDLGFWKMIGKRHKEKAMMYLEKVQMVDFAQKHISELSGGQQQRVFLARAFAQEADLYLLDEPFAGIDVSSEEIIADLLIELQRKNKTIIMVHHQIDTLSKYFDEVLMVKNGKNMLYGNVKEVITTENLQLLYN